MVDPYRCPIPPGFIVEGSISDDFDKFKDTTNYSSFKDPSGIVHGLNFGVSKRWKNDKIETANVVAGFQFKIGPDVGTRWNAIQQNLGQVKSGDISLIFPRAEPGTNARGVYGVQIKWAISNDPNGDHRVTSQAKLFKELPHPEYSNKHGFDNLFNVDNPSPDIVDVKDGTWHGFLATVYNDPYQGGNVTIKLWYNPTDTHDFNDFVFLGMGVDTTEKPIPPRGPMSWGIDHNHEWMSGVWGNALFRAEHDLGIRIDDIPAEQVEIKNMYAANVGVYENNPLSNPPPSLNLKRILEYRGFSFPASIRSVAEGFGVTAPISVREITERLQKNIL